MTVFLGLPGWASTRKVTPIWIFVKQETVSGSGIRWAVYKSAPRSRQITTPAPLYSVFYRPDALPAAQPTASKHWRLIYLLTYFLAYLLNQNSHCASVSHCSLNFECPRLGCGFLWKILVLEKCNFGPWKSLNFVLWVCYEPWVKGCGFCGGSKIAKANWQGQSPLTQGWRYHTARDVKIHSTVILNMALLYQS